MLTYNNNELYHYGVLGMKWGVRKQEPRSTITKRSASYGKKGRMWNNKYYKNGKFTAVGRNKYGTVKKYKANYNLDRIQKVILAGFAIGTVAYLASPAGRDIAMLGKTWFSTSMKPGTLVQNIAPAGRDFSTSFYGARDKQTRQFFLKQFTQSANPFFRTAPRNTATLFKNDKRLKIAGRYQMDKALKEAAKVQDIFTTGGMKNGFGFDTTSGAHTIKSIKTFKDRTKVWQEFGAMNEGSRQQIISRLHKKGYSGFKDVNDMMINWGSTPTVFFGKNSGLREIKRTKVNVAKAHNMNVKLKLGHEKAQVLMKTLGRTTMYGGSIGVSVVDNAKNDNDHAIYLYNKPYKELTKTQKEQVSKYYSMKPGERKKIRSTNVKSRKSK